MKELTRVSYLLQYHTDHFVKAWDARLELASLCASYLTFPCFSPHVHSADIRLSVLRGDYAFQEYSVLNWIHHARAFHSRETKFHGCNTSRLDESILSLYQRYPGESSRSTPETSSGTGVRNETAVLQALDACQKVGDLVDDVRINEADSRKTYILHLPRVVVEILLQVWDNQHLVFSAELRKSEQSWKSFRRWKEKKIL